MPRVKNSSNYSLTQLQMAEICCSILDQRLMVKSPPCSSSASVTSETGLRLMVMQYLGHVHTTRRRFELTMVSLCGARRALITAPMQLSSDNLRHRLSRLQNSLAATSTYWVMHPNLSAEVIQSHCPPTRCTPVSLSCESSRLTTRTYFSYSLLEHDDNTRIFTHTR